MSEKLSRIEWLIKYRTMSCPEHGGKIANSLVKGTFYCPKHEKVWRVMRNEQSWKAIWYFLDETKKQARIVTEIEQTKGNEQCPESN